jgi:hypothetical protein
MEFAVRTSVAIGFLAGAAFFYAATAMNQADSRVVAIAVITGFVLILLGIIAHNREGESA